MEYFRRFGRRYLPLLAAFGIMIGSATADNITITDLESGIPGLTVPAGVQFTILPDSTTNFLHFTLTMNQRPYTPQTIYTDLFDDTIGGTLSDRIVIAVASPTTVEVKFASVPATLTVPSGALKTNFFAVEQLNTPQQVGVVYFTGVTDGNFHFWVVSEPAPTVPEPTSLILLGSGIVAGSSFVRWRKRWRGAARSRRSTN
ncbi:MAG TPA: PEP-CTERM sorting domain-containing protein [Terriglobales bacterium]|nr:PEP-CTERM sorting domain-containing protein [Terriglobales bacterium]